MAIKYLNALAINGNGGTVLDVQGSQGQLFSVTDSLTGDIFAVSDISGVPILKVVSSGIVLIDGSLSSTGNAAVSGFVQATTFIGDLNGTINTATTGVTQTAGDDSTKIATTAYADAAAAAVPIGDYVTLATDQTITGSKTFSDGPYYNGTTYWRVSSADAALQRADARDDGTLAFSRLHWYGESDTGATSNFRHAYYDGAGYINVTAASGRLTFGSKVAGSTPTAAGDLTTKAYVDALTPGAGVFLPLAGGTMDNTNLVTNMNADLLDGQEGSYYLDYANFTGTPTIPTVGDGEINGATSGLGITGSMSATANQAGDTTFTVTSNAVTAATASTIAYRDSAADLNVRLLRANYANQSTISGAMAFRVNNGADNYTRYCSSSSAIRTFLGVPASGDLGNYLPLVGGTMAGTITMDNHRITSIEELRFNNGGNISNQINTDVDIATETVANVPIADYTAAFYDFVIKKGTNVRSGTVYACHDGTNVEYTETSTNDLGDTSDVTLSVAISGTNMKLLATATSADWSVKSLIRAI